MSYAAFTHTERTDVCQSLGLNGVEFSENKDESSQMWRESDHQESEQLSSDQIRPCSLHVHGQNTEPRTALDAGPLFMVCSG